jgi:opacity protein-like surface antigen
MGSPTSTRIGGAVNFPVTSNLSVEAELGYRRGEGDINALSSSVSMLYAPLHVGRITPYLAAGVGLEEFGAPVVLPGRSEIFTQSKLAFAVNAGGGLKVPVDDKWSLRSDARWFKSLGRNGSEHWRLYQGASFGVGKRGDAKDYR